MKYKTSIDLGKRKSSIKNSSRFTKKNLRNYFSGGMKSRGPLSNPLAKMSKTRKEKIKKIGAIVLGVFFVVVFIGFLGGLWYLQSVTEDLPSPDSLFGEVDQATAIYASSKQADTDDNELLYKMFKENLDYVTIDQIPERIRWAVIASEDVDFYQHPGFDVKGLIAAVLYECCKVGNPRGGSTITQQLIKQRSGIGSERSLERKVKELVLAIQTERIYSKDQILEMYMNINNYGGNIYGIKTAAKFYYGKDLKDLTIAEAAVLARIPQNPVYNSPTLSEDGKERAENERQYVIKQLENNFNKINNQIKDEDQLFTEEEIEAAKTEELKYIEPKIDIKAPHFVVYVQKVLTQNPYNNGQPFTLDELKTGGFKIYTSLDMGVQTIAQEEVANGVLKNAKPYRGNNGAVIITKPSSGDIVAMVGSKDYFAPSEGKLFDGNVNVTDTLQSMGSSMKPAAYYKAFEMGLSSPGSYLPDIPVEIGSYKPKNYDGKFKGPTTRATAREQLRESRNLPAVIITDAVGVSNYVKTLIDFGYPTIAANPSGYGHSLVLGGGDITMVEHAQGYSVFATGGFLVRNDPVQKITKYNPNTKTDDVIYEKEVKKEVVADQRAVYLVNNILNNKTGGPGATVDGRDFAGKTGTSDESKDTVYVGYSPDIVILGWNGNNDNTPMSASAFGENVTKPWVTNLMKRIAPYFPEKSAFPRPGGIKSGNACSDGDANVDRTTCADQGGDLIIDGKVPPSYISKKKFRVCTDQLDHLARDIDEKLGFAVDNDVNIYRMVSPSLQTFLDKALSQVIPTEYCTIQRGPNGNNPWATFTSPTDGSTVNGSPINFDIKGFSIAGVVTKIDLIFNGQTYTAQSNTLVQSVPAPLEPGIYPARARVYDNTGLVGETSISIRIGNTNPALNVNGPLNATVGNVVNFTRTYAGPSTITTYRLVILNAANTVVNPNNNTFNGAGNATFTFTAPGTYTYYVLATTNNGVTFQSSSKTIIVTP